MPASNLNIGALSVGLAALGTVLGAFAVSNDIGRALHHQPELIGTSLVLVVSGAALLALAGLPLTSGLPEQFFSAAGLLFTLCGLLVGIAGAVRDVDRLHSPAITAKVTAGSSLHGQVKVANLTGERRLAIVVEGLKRPDSRGRYRLSTIQRTYVGADDDNKVDHTIDIDIPAGVFERAQIRSWPVKKGDVATDRSIPRQRRRPCVVDTEKTACIDVRLGPIPTSPEVTLDWTGAGTAKERLKLHVKASNAPARPRDDQPKRVAVRVKAKKGSKRELIYRALLRPGPGGKVNETVMLPVTSAFGRVCAEASFVVGVRDYPPVRCPLDTVKPGRAAVEIRSP